LATRTQALGLERSVGGRLVPRDRQIAIMRICALVGCAYEWGGQATFWGPRVGLSMEDCDFLVTGGGSWSAREQALIDAVDAVERDGGLDDAGWAALRSFFDDEQIIELLAAVGWYRTICTFCNALDLEPEPWLRAWPGA
jgi:alkylhydroperoxidase family enzyme